MVCDMHTLWLLIILVGKIFPRGLALFLDAFTRALKLSVPWRER